MDLVDLWGIADLRHVRRSIVGTNRWQIWVSGCSELVASDTKFSTSLRVYSSTTCTNLGLVTHANKEGFGLTPLSGDRRGC